MKDKKILKELRNGPMKSMKDDEYAMIEKEVNEKGIAGLKGYAKSMIEKAMREMAYSMKDAVRKHGEHDQSSHGNWATGGMGGASESDPGGYKAEARRDDAKDEANLRDTKTKEQVLSSSRSDKKVSEMAEKLSALSDKMASKTSDSFTRNRNIAYADKVKAISEKLTEAASANTSNARHFELVQQAYDAIGRLDSAIFSNAGAGRSFEAITMRASDYLTKVDDALYDLKGGSERNESYLFDLQSRSGA
jgi:hypothetical protein